MYVDEFEDGSCQRIGSRLMGRGDAIRLINQPAMEDQLFEFIYGHYVTRDIRRPFMWLAAYQAKYREHPPAEALNARVQAANDCKRPTARGHIKRAKDLGLISEEKDGKNVFYYLDRAQVEKAQLLIKFLPIIAKVVELQAQHPDDKTAGSDLLPPEVYYNIVDVGQFPED
jgi:hypothetical protein